MKQQQPMQPPAPPPQGQQPQGQGVPNVADTAGTGGGNIGVGQVPVPGEQGFTEMSNNQQSKYLPKLKGLVNQPNSWGAFNEHLDMLLSHNTELWNRLKILWTYIKHRVQYK